MHQSAHESATTPKRYRPLAVTLAAAGLVILGLALRLYRLGVQSLWLDEGGTWAEITRNGWPRLLSDLFSPNAAYPLYHLMLKAWVGLAGDSEWAMRFPSALAGTALVAAIIACAVELRWDTVRPGIAPLLAGGLVAVSPFALWHAQDAKVYSLLMLAVALLLWAALRTLRRETPGNWLLVAGIALTSLFVHRLALLPVAALLLALSVTRRDSVSRLQPVILGLLAMLAAALGVVGLARSVSSNGWQESGHSAANPFQSLWLNLSHFLLDRGNIEGYAGVPLLVWALPGLVLTAWGLVKLVRAAFGGRQRAILVLSLFLVPLLLFALALAFAPIYEARYAAVAFPAWVLVTVWPFLDERQRTVDAGRSTINRPASTVHRPTDWLAAGRWLLVVAFIAINGVVLLQPNHGLFSGAAVKEQWRDGVAAIAARAHPDDMFILHPYYTLPLWDYYAPRVTPDPLPQVTLFSNFAEGDCAETYRGDAGRISECFRRRYDEPFNRAAFGKKRALLLIAPEHAATIDRPPTPDDRFGWMGLRFQYDQNSWPCGGQRFVGVETMCQSYPEAYNAGGGGQVPEPDVRLEAVFGGELELRGYSLDLLGGAARPGGALPVTLYWQAAAPPTRNYSMFLHLCRDCEQPPLAGVDRPPLEGYAPAGLTTTWQVGDPVHDERSLPLPADLPPGRYTLILGVRPADEDPMNLELRLPITGTQAKTLGTTRLVLATIEITPP